MTVALFACASLIALAHTRDISEADAAQDSAAPSLVVSSEPIPTRSEAFHGIHIVERNEGLMVWRVGPGPLDGEMISSSTLARGDLIELIDGAPATRATWDALITRAVGSEVTLGYREGIDRVSGKPNTQGAQRTIKFILDDANVWSGSWKRAGTAGHAPLAPLAEFPLQEGVDGSATDAALILLGPAARSRSEKLLTWLADLPSREQDSTTPPLLRAIFAQPQKSPALIRAAVPAKEAFTTAPFHTTAQLIAGLAGNRDCALPIAHGKFAIEHTDAAVWYLDFLLNEARAQFRAHVTDEIAQMPGLRPLVVERLDRLIVSGVNSRESMRALAQLPAFTPIDAAAIIAHFEVTPNIAPTVASSPAAELPAALVGAVDGTILAASEIAELGWVVIGGTGNNRYDLGVVAAVFDFGGDDHYQWNAAAKSHRLVVDLAGNDVHNGDGVVGPAGSIGAVSIIDDHAGNDIYNGGALTVGSVLGISMLLDRAGDDVYHGGAWSLGASAGGAAILLDLNGRDTYDGEGMALGVGGPLGIGAVIDVAGDDTATLGHRDSVYGVAGEHSGFGMGLGVGFRLAAAGGVGAYIDFAGRDIRRSGEFSQGCGYFLGLGILLDESGDDVSISDRYGIGSAAHQAAGVALDLAGNDTYIARTAAQIGGAWDESIAIFVDEGGDDSYRVDALSLGAAAQQALGIAVDRSGADIYRVTNNAMAVLGISPDQSYVSQLSQMPLTKTPPTTLGAASANDYHYAATKLGSLAIFFDLAGLDCYPLTRFNNRIEFSDESTGTELANHDSVFVDANSTPNP